MPTCFPFASLATSPRQRCPSITSTSSTETIGRDEIPAAQDNQQRPLSYIEIPDEIDDVFDDEIVDLTVEESIRGRGRMLQDGEYALESLAIGADRERAKAGDCIEVQQFQVGKYNCHFILVKVIVQNASKQIIVRGIPVARTRCFHAKLPKKQNELCQIHLIEDDAGDEHPTLTTVRADTVLRKREVIITNAAWPKHNPGAFAFRHITDKDERNAATEAWGVLVCRWTFKIYSVRHGTQSKPIEEALVRIHSSQVAEAHRDSEEVIANQWRGGRRKGGSWLPGGVRGCLDTVLDLTVSQNIRRRNPFNRLSGQKYTVFDSFSGAGGVSRGAQMAGCKIEYAIDKAREVWNTYRTNFPGTRLYKMSINEFIQRTANVHIRVDILHLSPPCQYFSPAHTHQSTNDDENIFALFSGIALVKKVRPRIVTIEQTFGIMHDRHKEYMQTLVGDLTYFGYSVRWKVVRLCTWGAAQDRKRLVVIAAGPGERLPPFPPATHSEGGQGGLKPFTTIDSVLRGIRHGTNLHNISAARRFVPPRASYSGARLAGTLTTAGSEMYHPSGTREFTLRECASLQGFPHYHRFLGNKTSIKRQIGNAFPPSTVRVLYTHLENWLLREDGINKVDDVIIVDSEGSNNAPGLDDAVIAVDEEEEEAFHFRGLDGDSPMIDLT